MSNAARGCGNRLHMFLQLSSTKQKQLLQAMRGPSSPCFSNLCQQLQLKAKATTLLCPATRATHNREANWWLPVMCIIVMAAVLPCGGAGLNVTGKLWYKVFDESSNVLFKADLTYSAQIDGGLWKITTQPAVTNGSDAILFNQVKTDGTNVYSSTYLNQKLQAPTGKSPRNQAVAEIYEGTIPRGDHTFAAAIWLAFGSRDYINSHTNGRLRLIWIDGQLRPNDVPVQIAQWPGASGAIREISFLSEDRRLQEALYRVEGLTNAGSEFFPTRFKLVRFSPSLNPSQESAMVVLGTLEGVVENVNEALSNFDMQAPVAGTTAVFDRRKEDRGSVKAGVSYLLGTSTALSAEGVSTARSITISNANRTASRVLAQSTIPRGSVRRLIFVAFAVITGLAAIFALLRTKGEK